MTAFSVLIVVFLFTAVSSVFCHAQSINVRPCAEEQSPSRPTLRRRQPVQKKELGETPVDSTDVSEPCSTLLNKSVPEENLKQQRIRLEGLKGLPESDVMFVLRANRLKFEDQAFDPHLLSQAEVIITDLLTKKGYVHASVSSRVENTPTNQNSVTFVIEEGPRLKIAEIRFEENKIFPSPLLAGEMKKYLERFESGRDGYDADVFEYCLHQLNNFVRSQGYLRANFRDPRIEENNDGLIVTLRGNEGTLYRLGRLKIEGSSVLLPEQIDEMLGLKPGNAVNGELLSKVLYEDVKQYYGDRGYIQYTAEVSPEFSVRPGTTDGVVDLEITIDEGRRFKIRKINFAGEKLPETELRGLLLLRDGDIYNEKLFEQCINRLNDMGWFQFIDKDKDTDFRTNEEEGLVDITIKLTKREG